MRLVLVFCLPLVQGCGLGVLAAGAGVSKSGTAQIMSAYTEYAISMEKINLEREKSGLKPRPILTKEEWMKGMTEEDERKRREEEYAENEKKFVP